MSKKQEETYYVEKILDKKVSKRGTLYKVKWVGYSLEECTWEPRQHLKHATEEIRVFERICEVLSR